MVNEYMILQTNSTTNTKSLFVNRPPVSNQDLLVSGPKPNKVHSHFSCSLDDMGPGKPRPKPR